MSEDYKIVKGAFGGGGSNQSAPTPTPAYEDQEGLIYNGARYSDYQFAQIKDLLSEGPIEGLVTGEYTYSGSIGNLGYNSVSMKLFNNTITDTDDARFLPSIFWNGNPLVDSQNKFNFQQIDVAYTKGGPLGTNDEDSNVGPSSFIRSINERLRGPNALATTNEEITNFKKTYKIVNNECNKVDINFRINSLYATLKYQDITDQTYWSEEGVASSNVNNNTFTLIGEGRTADQSTTAAGVGSVVNYSFEVRVHWHPIFKEGVANQYKDDLIANNVTVLGQTNDIVYTPSKGKEFGTVALVMKGKITQGYVKQLTLDFSEVFPDLNSNPNWIGWEITLLKISPESTTSSRVTFLTLESIVERYYSSFRFPNSAVVTSKFNAEYFAKIPERSYDIRLLKVKVPTNYDPITKTYGNITTLPIGITKDTSQNFDGSSLYFSAIGSGYKNYNDATPPITDGLVGQFDAGNATANASLVITSWPNVGLDNGLKAVLGNGTYASPNGTNGPLKTGFSTNGRTGAKFTASQYARFVDSVTDAGTNPFNYNSKSITVFAACQWEAGTQNKIIRGTNASEWNLGFLNDSVNSPYTQRAFKFKNGSNYIFGSPKDSLFSDRNKNLDSGTHIVGAVIRPVGKQVDVYWDDTSYSAINSSDTSKFSAEIPKGLAVNNSTSSETSTCTLFELLIYNRDLSQNEAYQVRSWLYKKWSAKQTAVSYTTSDKLFSDRALSLNANLTFPLRTICGNGENTIDVGSSQVNPRNDLLPEKYYTSAYSDWYLSNQGFCSFYCDFWIKLDSNLADGNYCLLNREGQFNLAISLTGEKAVLTLRILKGVAYYTINKTLALKTSQLKTDWNRISVYIVPTVCRVNLVANQDTLKEKATYEANLRNSNNYLMIGSAAYANLNTNYNITKTTSAPTTASSLSASVGGDLTTTTNNITAVNIKEEIAPTETIKNMIDLANFGNKNCLKLVHYSYIPGAPLGLSAVGYPYIPLRVYDNYPDILNAKLVVNVNNRKEIITRLNIGNYDAYAGWILNQPLNAITLLNKNDAYIGSNYSSQSVGGNVSFIEYIVPRYAINGDTVSTRYPDVVTSAIDNFNRSNSVYLDWDKPKSPTTADLSSNQNTVTVAFDGYDIFYANRSSSTPYSYINNTGNLEMFIAKTITGVTLASPQGLVDGIKIDKVSFDRTSLINTNNNNIFSTLDGTTLITYTASGVTGAYASADLWDGTFKTEKQWTDNPAWCFYDLLTNKRYGAGNYIPEANVDKWSLYQIAKYCDELVSDGYGGIEPRFTCNTYVTSQDDALKVLNDFASVFRGMFYYANGYIYAINDMPQSTPVFTFTNANVVNGNFNYESTSVKDRNSAVYVRYVDKTNLYKPAVEYVENIEAIRRYGLKETELTAFACTSRGQAQRLGRWLLASQYLETDTVSFDTGPEAIYIKPGDVIKIYDNNKKYQTVGGRCNQIILSGNAGTANMTGYFALDRKIDFTMATGVNYKFSILSPYYNLDPSNPYAVTGSSDFKDFRKSFVSTFLISSGNNSTNIITGENYDSIVLTGATLNMFTGLNYTGMTQFTGGASGYSPKSILWNLEYNNQLDGTSNSDYDYYKVFRVQEGNTDSQVYSIFASQMMNLKYTQIESGLNLLPNTKIIAAATSPDYATFCLKAKDQFYQIDVNIFYNQAIYENTIGFKVFIKPRGDYASSNFNPDKDVKFYYTTIDISNPSLEMTIDGIPTDSLNENSEIRIYGINALNKASLSYVVASLITDADCISFNNLKNILDPNTKIDFLSRVDQAVVPLVPYGQVNFKNKMEVPLSFDFIKKTTDVIDPYAPFRPERNPGYKYRMVFIPEYAATKDQFKNLYNKYFTNDLFGEYYTVKLTSKASDVYKNVDSYGMFRSFSVGVDVVSYEAVGGVLDSSSDDFKSDQFKLITYDDLDNVGQLNLKDEASFFVNDVNNTYTLTLNGDLRTLTINAKLNLYNPFVRSYYLLMLPTSSVAIAPFDFQSYSFSIASDASWIVTRNQDNTVVTDARIVEIPLSVNQPVYSAALTADKFGKAFNLLEYKGYLIVNDIIMGAKFPAPSPTILAYTNQFIDGNSLNVANQYPIFAEKVKLIQVPPIIGDPRNLYNVIDAAGTNYLHFVFNWDVVSELRFTDPDPLNRNLGTVSPSNKQIRFDNILYRPTVNRNLTAGEIDGNVFANGASYFSVFGSPFYVENDSNEDVILPNTERDYKYNANKVFVGQIDAGKTFNKGFFNSSVLEHKILDNLYRNNGSHVYCDLSMASLTDHFGAFDFTNYPSAQDYYSVYLYPQFYDPYYDNTVDLLAEAAENIDVIYGVSNSLNNNYLRKMLNRNANIRQITAKTTNCSEFIQSPNNVIISNTNIKINTQGVPSALDYHGQFYRLGEIYNKLPPSARPYLSYDPALANSIVAGIPFIDNATPIFEVNLDPDVLNLKKDFLVKVYSFIDDGVYIDLRDSTLINQNNKTITIKLREGLTAKSKNYYFYTDDYTNPLVFNKNNTNLSFYELSNGKDWSYAYLLPLLRPGRFAKNNFFVQSFEMSFVLTFDKVKV